MSFFQTSSCIIYKKIVMQEKCYECCIVSLACFRVSSTFLTSSCIIYKQIVTLGNCFDCYIVSIVSYMVFKVFFLDLLLYHLDVESDAWVVLQRFYSFFC